MQCARLGLIVGKKAVPHATARNRIKRVIRERFRLARGGLGAVDVIVRVVAPVNREALHRHLDRLLAELTARLNERTMETP
jgi:ribonuclease P protein component